MGEGHGWNHNIHYHPVLLGAVAPGASRVLDVGCGDGLLTRRLRSGDRHVVGLDAHAAVHPHARGHAGAGDVGYVLGDVLAHPFVPASFDAVLAVASLHHVGTARGLRAMRELVRPGGTLAVVGLARIGSPADVAADVAAVFATRWLRARRGYRRQVARTCEPDETYAAVRRVVGEVLPGARFRRHVLWRYSVIWRRPAGGPDQADTKP
jgi:2-polyprenyl-3-methyl-5-hydroxy-6-metoxy-1,4-benzoquinol methylase